MSKKEFTPQVEKEQVKGMAQRARYIAYVQGIRKLNMKSMSDREIREKAARRGGKAL